MNEKPENLDPFDISQKQLYKALKLMNYDRSIKRAREIH